MPGARGIDYSKWDHLEDSSDDEKQGATHKAAIHITVLGFSGRDADQLNGNYTMLPQKNHKRPTFCRLAMGAPPSGKEPPVPTVLYYWDESDGSHLCGWWFGPSVGSDMVWAFNPGDASQPPPFGWREPWFYDVSKGARVLLVNASVDVPKNAEEVLAPPVAPLLGPAVKRLRGAAAPWRCVHCLGWLRSPAVLPCGHIVCREHAAEQREAYACPWSLGCASRRPHFVLGSEGWRVASQLEGLLGTLPPASTAPAEGSGATSSRAVAHASSSMDPDPLHEAVRTACSPGVLTAAYDKLGAGRAKAGKAAEAALAYAAARFVHEEFGGAMGLAEMNSALDTAAPVVMMNKTLRAKANCWVKRSGDPVALRVALEQLPLPALDFPPAPASEQLEADVESFAAGLRKAAESEEALEALAECPVCYGTVFEPVATPCGHIYCRRCLARTLDCEGDCPLCRGRLAGYIDHYAVCEQLQDLLTALWPEAYSRQLREVAATHRELREGQWLPIFGGLLAFPLQPCNLHVFEPNYRLMIRHALTSGARSFGACPGIGQATGEAEFGTELVRKNVTTLPNGRSFVETVGARRFRILESTVQDGYARARVEYLTELDKPSSDEGVRDFLEAFHSHAPGLAAALPRLREQGVVVAPLPLPEAPPGPADAEALAWAALHVCAAPVQAKVRFLSMDSRAQRLHELARLLREVPSAGSDLAAVLAADAAARGARGEEAAANVGADASAEPAGEAP